MSFSGSTTRAARSAIDRAAAKAGRGLKVSRYASLVKGILDKTPTGIGFTSITLHVDLAVEPGDAERAARLLQSAKKHCIVANSLKTPVDLRVLVTAA